MAVERRQFESKNVISALDKYVSALQSYTDATASDLVRTFREIKQELLKLLKRETGF